MSAQNANYRELAAEAQAAAATATLGNVRDRWLLSQAAWTELAVRSERAVKNHDKLIAQKAKQRAVLEAARPR